jgi:hypothetical protein
MGGLIISGVFLAQGTKVEMTCRWLYGGRKMTIGG